MHGVLSLIALQNGSYSGRFKFKCLGAKDEIVELPMYMSKEWAAAGSLLETFVQESKLRNRPLGLSESFARSANSTYDTYLPTPSICHAPDSQREQGRAKVDVGKMVSLFWKRNHTAAFFRCAKLTSSRRRSAPSSFVSIRRRLPVQDLVDTNGQAVNLNDGIGGKKGGERRTTELGIGSCRGRNWEVRCWRREAQTDKVEGDIMLA